MEANTHIASFGRGSKKKKKKGWIERHAPTNKISKTTRNKKKNPQNKTKQN